MYGVPRPWKAGTTQTPAAESTERASGSISSSEPTRPIPSRSHCAAAPAVTVVPSKQKLRAPSIDQSTSG